MKYKFLNSSLIISILFIPILISLPIYAEVLETLTITATVVSSTGPSDKNPIEVEGTESEPNTTVFCRYADETSIGNVEIWTGVSLVYNRDNRILAFDDFAVPVQPIIFEEDGTKYIRFSGTVSGRWSNNQTPSFVATWNEYKQTEHSGAVASCTTSYRLKGGSAVIIAPEGAVIDAPKDEFGVILQIVKALKNQIIIKKKNVLFPRKRTCKFCGVKG